MCNRMYDGTTPEGRVMQVMGTRVLAQKEAWVEKYVREIL